MIQLLLKNLLTICLLIIVLSCKGQNCNDINLQNKDYKEAVKEVRQTKFKLYEIINTNSSWIKNIEYYSCDEITGFLILVTKTNKQYIHKAIPVNLWYRFKGANSFGNFYTSNIKGRYKY